MSGQVSQPSQLLQMLCSHILPFSSVLHSHEAFVQGLDTSRPLEGFWLAGILALFSRKCCSSSKSGLLQPQSRQGMWT